MGHPHEFTWASSVPNSVIVTGTFDEWKETCHLQKDAAGRFAATVDLPYGAKVLFKYIVDGNWTHNPREACESDDSGNVNNVLHIPSEESVRAEEQRAKEEADRKAEEERKTLEAQQAAEKQAAAAKAQAAESARRGSVASNKSVTSANGAEPSLRDVAKETATEIKDEVSVIAAGAAVAAGAAFQHAFSAVSSAVRRASLSAPSEPSAILPGEKPVDPTPTPAVPRSGSALSAAFSSEALSGALKEAKSENVSTQPPVLPLVPEVPKENIVASQSTSATSGEAIGTVLPVVPEPPSTTVVPTATTTSSTPTVTSLVNSDAVASASATVQTAAADVKSAVSAAVAKVQESLPAASSVNKSGETSEDMPAPISYPMAVFASVSAAATAGAAAVTAALADTGDKTAQLYTEPTTSKSLLGKDEVQEIKAEHSNADVLHKNKIVEAVKSEVETVPAVSASSAKPSDAKDVTYGSAGKSDVAFIKETHAAPDVEHKTDLVKDIQAHVPTAAAVDGQSKTTNGISSTSSAVAPAPAIPVSPPTSSAPLTNGTTDLSGKSEVAAIKEDHPKAEVSKKTELVNEVKAAVSETPAAVTSSSISKKGTASKATSKTLTQADNSKTGISTKGGNDPKSKRYSTLGRKDSAPTEPPVTPKKPTASATSTPATGGRDAYTTAPSTPSSTPQGRERKSSFFQKVKSALSPHSKK